MPASKGILYSRYFFGRIVSNKYTGTKMDNKGILLSSLVPFEIKKMIGRIVNKIRH